MRLFLAIQLPADARRALAHVQEHARRPDGANEWRRHKVSWVKPENLHLTLKFLGEVPDADVPNLCQELARVPTAGLIVLQMVREPLFFPPRGRIRVIGVRLDEVREARLSRLYEGIEQACEAAGFARERRPFHPHVTLARAKFGLPDDYRYRYHDLDGLANTPALTVEVAEFVLVQSRLLPEGPEYSSVARFPLEVGPPSRAEL